MDVNKILGIIGNHDGDAVDLAKSLGGALEKRRAQTAKKRAGGQELPPSKFMPNVPRAVHATEGRVVEPNQNGIGWSKDRASQEIRASHYEDGRSKSHVGYVNPIDFLHATTSNDDELRTIVKSAGELKKEKIEKETQSPFLTIKDGKIDGHEGRHRMAALAKAGYTSVPVAIHYRGNRGEFREPIDSMTFGPQYNEKRNPVTVSNMVPLHRDYADQINDMMAQHENHFAEGGEIAAPPAAMHEPHRRAKEQGYSIDGYHVTRGRDANAISSASRFDPYATRSPGETATFFWDNPDAANEWAHHVAGVKSFDPDEMDDRDLDRAERHATAVMPVRIHPGKHLEVDWPEETGTNYYDNRHMARIIREAKKEGYDTIRIQGMVEGDLHNDYADDIPPAHDQIAVLNPAMIRSEFAEFDPEKKGRDDIGAANGGAIDHMAGGGFEDNAPPPMGHNNPPERMSYEDLHPQLISQRMPTNVRSQEDPNQEMLLANVDAMKRNPRVFSHNINLVKGYGHLKDEEMQGSDDETAENFINHMKDNLLFLHDSMQPELRNRAKLWYVGANKFANKIADRHGVPLAASSAAIAAMSPQKDWFQNASLAERLMDIHHSQAETPYTRDMEMTANRIFGDTKYDSLLNAIRGKKYSEIEDPTEKAVWLRLFDQTYHDPSYRQLSPEGDLGDFNKNDDGSHSKMAWGSLNEISKGISALLGGANRDLISQLMGERHKIRNFYNNILDPNSPTDDVTVDTHAVAAALLRPLASNGIPVAHNFKNSPEAGFEAAKGDNDTGVQGTYPLYVEAIRRAAAERGTLPREMQSITWEAVRGLFPDTFKNESNLAAVDQIWSKYRSGEIDVNEARNQIFNLAGGINAPAWSGEQGSGANEEAPDSSYQRKLSSSGVYGEPSGMESGVGGGDSSPFTGLEEKDIQGFERHRQLAWASRQAFGKESGIPQSFQKRNGRGREQDLGVPVAAVHSPTQNALEQFSASGISAPEMLELKSGTKAADRFYQAIMDAKSSHASGASVHAYDPKEYRSMRLFLTPDGNAGFALKGDDIVSVFNNRNGGMKNVSNAMLQLAVQQGGRKLDAFDTELPHIYSRNKFRVVARMPWNEDYKPEGWNHADYEKYNKGRPDVVFMAFDPKRNDLYDGREGEIVNDYDQAVNLQTKGVNRANKALSRNIKKADGGSIDISHALEVARRAKGKNSHDDPESMIRRALDVAFRYGS